MTGIATLSFDELLGLTPCGRQDLRLFPFNITRHTPELLGDVALPDRGLCWSRRFVHASFGCRGATAPPHDDIDMGRVLHTAVTGRRRTRLSHVNPPQQENANRVVRSGHAASPHSVAWQGCLKQMATLRDIGSLHPVTVRSDVDFYPPDYGACPALAQVRGYEIPRHPGQNLFMPSGHWHGVHCADAGTGLSYRAVSPRLARRPHRAVTLFARSPVDRLADRSAPDRWFDWQRRQATACAAVAVRLAADVP